jgi:hypothetical protein
MPGKYWPATGPSSPPDCGPTRKNCFASFLNLLANAFKFTRRGDRVTLGARSRRKGRGGFLGGQDTGWGIPHSTRSADLLTSEKGGGAGMGLTHRSSVGGRARQGKMARFGPAPNQGTTVEFLSPGRPAMKARLFLVEDEPGMRQVTRVLLQTGGLSRRRGRVRRGSPDGAQGRPPPGACCCRTSTSPDCPG